MYSINHPQLKRSTRVTHVSHAWCRWCFSYKCVCELKSTRIYMHTNYTYVRMFLYTHVYICVHSYAQLSSSNHSVLSQSLLQLAMPQLSYIMLSFPIQLFSSFPEGPELHYTIQLASQSSYVVEDKVADEVKYCSYYS